MSRFYSSASRVALRSAACSALAVVSVSAYAHSPFLLPNSFQAGGRNPTISVDVSLTDNFFIPDLAFGKHPFSVTAPDGTTVAIPESDIFQLPIRTSVEHKLAEAKPGVYLVTAGPRGANPRRSYVDSEGKSLRIQNNEVPAGAVLKSHTQSVALAHAYIRVGSAADATAVAKASGRGLEFVPISNPSSLAVGGKFDFAVHYNGKPLADHAVSLVYSNMDYSGTSERDSATTNGRGRVSYALEKPGVYMASIRYTEDGPVRDDKPTMSYSTSLTFNVISSEHAEAAKRAAEAAAERARAREQAAGGGQQGAQAAGGAQRGQAPAAGGGGQRGQAPAAGGGQPRQPQAQGQGPGRGGQDQAGARGGRGDGAGAGQGAGGGRGQGGERGGRGGEGGGRPARQ